MRAPTPPPRRSPFNPHGFPYGRIVVFLLFSAGLLLFVAYDYLFPALEAWRSARDAFGAEASHQKGLILVSAQSRLILLLVLFLLLAVWLLVFPIGKYFFPRSHKRAEPTRYPDAWAESAKRVKVEDLDDES